MVPIQAWENNWNYVILYIWYHQDIVYQSCPRVTFLGSDPTRSGETLTRPAIADKKSDPTQPAARPFPNYLLIS